MPLIKDNRLVKDPWVSLGDGEALGADDRDVIVSVERWHEERDALAARKGSMGVRLRSEQSPTLIAGDLEHFQLVAIEFPVFKDGRGYSYARLLRDRYGFKGEVRAVGDVLRDQFFFMHRCGIDAFKVADGKALDGWLEALKEFSAVYQSAADGRQSIIARRLYQPQAAE